MASLEAQQARRPTAEHERTTVNGLGLQEAQARHQKGNERINDRICYFRRARVHADARQQKGTERIIARRRYCVRAIVHVAVRQQKGTEEKRSGTDAPMERLGALRPGLRRLRGPNRVP